MPKSMFGWMDGNENERRIPVTMQLYLFGFKEIERK